MQLAEAGTAHAKHLLDDRPMAGFVQRLDAVNAAADRSQRFVWRFERADLGVLGRRLFGYAWWLRT